ncbi:MAG: hypothetical protein AAFY71_24160, partial [Bacteroidota bacterium]
MRSLNTLALILFQLLVITFPWSSTQAQISSGYYLPVPAGCNTIGPNLVVNPEFEEGNTGFTTSFLFRPDGVCYWGDYTIAQSIEQPEPDCYDVPATYIPSNDFPTYTPAGVPFNLTHIWAVTDRLGPGSRSFMIVDPCDPLGNSLTDSCSASDPTDGRIWEQAIEICPQETYAFSVFAKNIYASDAFQWPGADVQPDFELSINGNPISNYFVDGVPGQNGSYELPQSIFADSARWFQISGVYLTSDTNLATLRIRNLVQGKDGNDLALDGLFFGLCGKAIELNIGGNIPQCDDLGNISPITFRVNQATQNSGWQYYQWMKDGNVEAEGALNPGDLIPEYTSSSDIDGKFFGTYQLITYTSQNPTTDCGNASQAVSILDSCDVTFPVEFGSFVGKIENQRAVLNWETVSELNNQGFEIQFSRDGKSYKRMGFVEGNGTAQGVNKYEFVTAKLQLGNYFFRLEQRDFDGGIHYSNIVELNVSSSNIIFDMYPNPTDLSTTIR